jgi:ribose 5-phosphate isomerase
MTSSKLKKECVKLGVEITEKQYAHCIDIAIDAPNGVHFSGTDTHCLVTN